MRTYDPHVVTDGGTSMGTDAGAGTGDDAAPQLVLRVSGRSTRVELRGDPGAPLSVEGGDVTQRADGSVDISPRASTVTIVCPENAQVVLSTASGNVSVRGHVADVKVITQSGSVVIERAVDADVRTMSGKVAIESCIHSCRVVTKSGRVSVGTAHDIGISTASARVDVGRATIAAVQTISGAVSLGCELFAQVLARTMSGTVDITVPAGSPATMRLTSTSGRIRSEVPSGEGATLEVRTMSGAIRVASQ